MYKIFCDETWTGNNVKAKRGYYVFYGVMVEEDYEDRLLKRIEEFKTRRGLVIENTPVEVKWAKVEEEWRQSKESNRTNRHEEFLDIFFDALKTKTLTFGYLFLRKSEYERVESEFAKQQPDNKHNFFFMLYFQFLYHCFIRTQVEQKPCQIFIDSRDMGAIGSGYDIERLKEILNKRLYRDASPKYQLSLSKELQRQLSDSIQLVNLVESKQEPLVQLSDLCAGCVRFALENELQPPPTQEQLALFANTQQHWDDKPASGRESLARYFYRRLRKIDRYKDINLLKVSYHHRFSIFPFEFTK